MWRTKVRIARGKGETEGGKKRQVGTDTVYMADN